MYTRKFYQLTLTALISTALTACSTPFLGGVTPAGTPHNPSNPTTSGDLCSNHLVPVKAGATWSYSSTGLTPNPISFTSMIQSVHQGGFSTSTHFDGNIALDQDWACKPEGLVALPVGTGQSPLALALDGVIGSLGISNVTGVTLPPDPQPGQPWTYAFDVTGSIAQGDLTANATGTVTSTMTVQGTESITVPAGTFTAKKIAAATTIQLTANYSGFSLPLSSSVKSVFWFAQGVGLVKSTQSGDLPGMSLNAVTELQSYKVP